jgi:hypothetical protein
MARTGLEASQPESANTVQSALDESQARILRNIRGPAREGRSARTEELVVSSSANENIGGTVAPSQRLMMEREEARPANYVETVENAGTSAVNTTSFQEPELPY